MATHGTGWLSHHDISVNELLRCVARTGSLTPAGADAVAAVGRVMAGLSHGDGLVFAGITPEVFASARRQRIRRSFAGLSTTAEF
jgi:hypothetical protein